MKSLRAILINLMPGLLILLHADAQDSRLAGRRHLEPHSVQISCVKTTHLVFPAAILSADRGSSDILAQKAEGAENILQVKAARADFPETNLTVLTKGGQLYSFIVNYAAAPGRLHVIVTGEEAHSDKVQLAPGEVHLPFLQAQAQQAAGSLARLRGPRARKWGIRFRIDGLFIRGDQVYCRLRIENRSPIGYAVGGIHFSIRDQVKLKRTAVQETEINPLLFPHEPPVIAAGSGLTLVMVLPKLTLPDGQYLHVQLLEKGGGRHLPLRLTNRSLIQAAPLPQG